MDARNRSGVSVPAARRTQAERRLATTTAILDATIDNLVERGYAGTSTTEICKRAGVSQGALFRHWSSKGELLAAAAAHLFGRVTAAYEATATAKADMSVSEAVELLWESYQQPDLQAVIELYVAARTDVDLAAALREIEPAHRANLHRIAAGVLPPELAGDADIASIIDVSIAAVQGATMAIAAAPDPASVKQAILRGLDRVLPGRGRPPSG